MKKLLIILLVLISSLSFAQEIKRTWHWHFGSHEGLDFSTGVSVPLKNSSINSWGGCSSISDTNGNLLCYIGDSLASYNYQNIWNRNNAVMPNGYPIIGNPSGPQADLIVPEPLNDSIIYIFYVYQGQPFTGGLYYSIVNMKLDGGMGDVTKKNIFLFNNLGYVEVAGTKAANDTDIWILTLKQFSDSFFVFRLTPNGLDTNPIISVCGLDSNGSSGCMKFSPSGTKLALTGTDGYYIELLNFNDTTGIVYSPKPILFSFPYSQNAQGIEFSPDESKLYWTLTATRKYLFQANLLAGSDTAIEHSVTLIDSVVTPNNQGLGALQIGPDGKIYLTKVRDHYLGAINHPNKLGKACNYIDSAVELPYYSYTDTVCFYGLPNFVSSYFYHNPFIENTPTNIMTNNNILTFPNPATKTLNLKLNEQYVGQMTITIMDITGRKMLLSFVSITSDIVQIDVSSLPTGMYIMSITNNKNTTSNQKFLKY